ncbi:hypothetical protein HNP12_000226 [Aeromonas hydrophila]|uniref:hypothetical protein n=1 Tax=Aeromonas hydrophila TaxID=644 RepID=UPI002168C432|nr:hypothetical protein [Aeromonas hydrophila]MCS3766187.1 hypothetical protein [Aeromonas hydrophila]
MDTLIYKFGVELHEMNAHLDLQEATWDDLVSMLQNDIRFVQDKNQVSGIVGCEMMDAYRKNDNVIARELFYLDVDGGATIEQVEAEMAEYEYFIYATYSHTAQKHKFRLIMPLQQPVLFEDWQARKPAYEAAFPYADPASFVCSQFMKAPVMSPVNQQDFFTRRNNGKLFDAYAFAAKEAPKFALAPVVQIDPTAINDVVQCALQNCHALNSHNIRWKSCQAMKTLGFDENVAVSVLRMSGSNHDDSYWRKEFQKAKGQGGVQAFYKLISYNTKAQVSAFALAAAQRLTANSVSTPKTVSPFSQEFYLTEDQYLGDVLGRCEFGYVNLLIADCGVGKNYTTSRLPKAWVVSPLRIIVQQNANSANQQGDEVEAMISNVEENTAKANQERALCTWNKLRHIYQQHTEGADLSNLSDITLFVDESHGLYLDIYKQDVINVIYDIVEAKIFQRVIFMSGTSSADDYHITFDKVIRVRKESAPKLTTKVITNDVYSQVAYSVMNSTADGIVVLWNNKNQIDKLNALINGSKNLLTVTADLEVKNSPDVLKLKEEEVLDAKYNGVIGTYSIVEGMNIKNEVDTVDVFVVGNETVERIEQVSNRYRKAKTVRVFHVVPKGEPDLDYSILVRKDVVAEANKISSNLNMLLDSMTSTPAARFTLAKGQMHILRDIKDEANKHTLLRLRNTTAGCEFTTNTVGIDWSVSNSKARYDSYNFQSYKDRLSKLNHHVRLVFSNMVPLSKEEQEAIEAEAEASKAQRQADALQNVIDIILRDTVEDAYKEMLENNEETFERDLLVQVMRVQSYIAPADIIDMLKNNKYKEVLVDIERVKRDNKIVNYVNSNIQVGDSIDADTKCKHAEAIMAIWRTDKTIQAADIDLGKVAKYESGSITKASANSILKRYIVMTASATSRSQGAVVRASVVVATTTSTYRIAKQTTKDERQLQQVVAVKQAVTPAGLELLAARRAAV